MDQARVTIWKDAKGYHMVKASDPTVELVYPKHLAKGFYLDVVKAAIEGDEGEE